MRLTYWMYTGPAHIGTLRVATSFQNVHAIMHAPLGDDYFNVIRSMLERKRDFTPVTTSIVDRHVLAQGSKEKVIQNIKRKDLENKPDLIILTPTCTSSILQEDLDNFVNRANINTNADILLADVNHYRVNELQAADKTLEQIITFYLEKFKGYYPKTKNPSVNIIGTLNLGFHNQHDLTELKKLFKDLNIEINMIVPENCSVKDLPKLTQAWFNFVPFREIGLSAAQFLKNKYNMPVVSITPIGITQTALAIKSFEKIIKLKKSNINYDPYIERQTRYLCQSAWFSKSIDCQNLVGKTAIVFGDASHAVSFTKILTIDLGIKVILAGTYCNQHENWFRKELESYCQNIIVCNDQNLVAEKIKELQPSVIFGTQMERHVGKCLNIPCGVISAPTHIQNYPLGYKPFVGYEGANQISDLIYNSFTLGMEDHLLELFGGHDTKEFHVTETKSLLGWSEEAKQYLDKIPTFIRKKVIHRVENYVHQYDIDHVSLDLLYHIKELNED